MVTHMLVQMPLLIVVGLFIGDFVTKKFPRFFNKYNKSGIPGIVLVYIVTMYWMIPRAMDEALLLQTVEIFKYISFPFFVWVHLLYSWPKLTSLGKGFFIIYYFQVFGMMSWFYITYSI